ncbi:TIGR01906 family membrane protein [Thermoflexus sp.]|uniref:TIGR01906 family membrane protein n=1 Tax=Thermoflexus sp. TaxID=1969742 RepID=UPI001761F4AC|nr:TIGR01906 family membrane protein [Thermoflexus sp.]
MLSRVLSALIIFSLPAVLLLLNVRLLMSDWFIRMEYARPDFPPDLYGMSPEERLELALTGLRSVTQPPGASILREIRFADGRPAFNEREIRHMQDVYVLQGAAFRVGLILALALIGAWAYLWFSPATRPLAWQSLNWGGLLTLGLVLGILLGFLLSFDAAFTLFHRVFFEGDTWLFLPTDTLIRLYPEKFWFDAAVGIGGLTLLEAIALILLTRWRLSLR